MRDLLHNALIYLDSSCRAPLAQRIELLTSDQAAGGSNPSGRAKFYVSRVRDSNPEPAPTNRRKSPTLWRAPAGEAPPRPAPLPDKVRSLGYPALYPRQGNGVIAEAHAVRIPQGAPA